MALQKSLTYKTIVLANAYFRVVYPTVGLDKTTMTFGVWPFATQAAAADQSNLLSDAAVTVSDVPYSLTGTNIFEQAYEYLKTLPDYAGAVDVLEDGQTA